MLINGIVGFAPTKESLMFEILDNTSYNFDIQTDEINDEISEYIDRNKGVLNAYKKLHERYHDERFFEKYIVFTRLIYGVLLSAHKWDNETRNKFCTERDEIIKECKEDCLQSQIDYYSKNPQTLFSGKPNEPKWFLEEPSKDMKRLKEDCGYIEYSFGCERGGVKLDDLIKKAKQLFGMEWKLVLPYVICNDNYTRIVIASEKPLSLEVC